jgi:hypothetical protein
MRKNGVYFDGSNTTNRILDVLEQERPKVICIDELDKMPRIFQNQLLNFVESGRVKVDQQKKHLSLQISAESKTGTSVAEICLSSPRHNFSVVNSKVLCIAIEFNFFTCTSTLGRGLSNRLSIVALSPSCISVCSVVITIPVLKSGSSINKYFKIPLYVEIALN